MEHICKTCIYMQKVKTRLLCMNVNNEGRRIEVTDTCGSWESIEDKPQCEREGGTVRMLPINDCSFCSEFRPTMNDTNICLLNKDISPVWNGGIPESCPLVSSDNHEIRLNHFSKKGVNQTLDCFSEGGE